MSDEKYLIRKQIIIEGGIKVHGENVIIPFANMDISMPVGSTIDSTATLATEEKLEELVKAGISGSHKSIAGEFKVDTAAEAAAALATYAAGGDLTFTNGRIFNNGNSTPGEVFYIVPNTGSTYKAEEIIVGAAKELIALSNENAIDAQFTTVEDRVKAVEDSVALKEDITDVDTKIAAEAKARDDKDILIYGEVTANTGKIDSNVAALGTTNGRIDAVIIKDEDQDGRLEALELAESLDDKVWEGSLTASASLDVSNITDANGDKFDFTAGKKLEFVFEHTADAVEQGQDLVVDATNATPYSIGSIGFTAKISNAGILTLVKPAGAGAIGDFKLIRVVEAKAILASTVAYTKNESNARYATPAQVNIVDAKVATLATTVNGKLGTTDQSIADTTTKSVVGAINNLIGKAAQDEGLLANLGSLKTTDGDDLSTTTEEIMTRKTFTAESYTRAEVDTAIKAAVDAALQTIMRVTFDDASTGNYKIGKE